MNKETERKFLVLNTDFIKEAGKSYKIKQAYLSKDPERTVRVRLKDDKAYLTIKGIGKQNGAERFEFEKEINVTDAMQLLDICLPEIITKTRYLVPYKGHAFEVDVFKGNNEGLVLCEIELNHVNEPFEKPNWLGKEVTGDKRYYNSYLSEHPFSKEKNKISPEK